MTLLLQIHEDLPQDVADGSCDVTGEGDFWKIAQVLFSS
jgi:hypothetical protein